MEDAISGKSVLVSGLRQELVENRQQLSLALVPE